jgi:apolipoprotein D and lipocalin family protein
MVKVVPAQIKIDPLRCMGDWFVQRLIPASNWLEGPAHNGMERYEHDPANDRVKVTYTFNKGAPDGPVVKTYQRGYVRKDKGGYGTEWAVRPYLGMVGLPFHLPFSLSYYILDVDPDSYMTASAPDGSWMYLITRQQVVDEAFLAPKLEKLVSLGFDKSKIKTMPQQPASK